jgi:hypothetical protein
MELNDFNGLIDGPLQGGLLVSFFDKRDVSTPFHVWHHGGMFQKVDLGPFVFVRESTTEMRAYSVVRGYYTVENPRPASNEEKMIAQEAIRHL